MFTSFVYFVSAKPISAAILVAK